MTASKSAPLLVIAGTGTEIGKTTFACALLRAWADRTASVAGIKPVESGGRGEDAEALGRASTFHVTRFTPPYLLMDPVSPHLAARREGRRIDLEEITAWTNTIRGRAGAVLLELAGGLFTPLSEDATNAYLARRLAPTRTLLVAPDRLGSLHDVIATALAAASLGLVIDGVVFSAPPIPDASTGTNATELARTFPTLPVLAELPRTTVDALVPSAKHVLDALHL